MNFYELVLEPKVTSPVVRAYAWARTPEEAMKMFLEQYIDDQNEYKVRSVTYLFAHDAPAFCYPPTLGRIAK